MLYTMEKEHFKEIIKIPKLLMSMTCATSDYNCKSQNKM